MKPSAEQLRSDFQYDPETGKIFWINGRRAGKEAFTYTSKRGYRVTTYRRAPTGETTLLAHRVAWAVYYGEWPSGNIDHINGNRLDNRISNLRDIPNAENAKNMARSSSNTSGISGVYLHRQTGKWCAQINAFGKTINLGLFADKSDAIIARKAAERTLSYHPNHGRPAVTQDALAHLLEAPHDQDQ